MAEKIYKCSEAERDRRYKAVREAMKEQGLDALIVWGDSGKWDWHHANTHYLSQVGGDGSESLMVFPLEGEPDLSIKTAGAYMIKNWMEYGSWISDLKGPEGGNWSKAAIRGLEKLKLTTATIGIPGMVGERDPIIFPSPFYTALCEELPGANFKDASGLIENIRAIKSPEEIALMERSHEIGEAAIDTMAEVARPGVPENEVLAAMFHTMISQGADIPIMMLYDTGRAKAGGSRLSYTKKRPLEPKDIVFMEFSPRVHGYASHLNQTAVVIDWPEGLEKSYEAWLASYRAGYNAIKPGITLDELRQAFHEPVVAAGFKYAPDRTPGGYGYGAGPFHGTGYGNESITGDYPTLREGMTIAIECGATNEARMPGIRMGDTVLVTGDGHRRLGKEPDIRICK